MSTPRHDVDRRRVPVLFRLKGRHDLGLLAGLVAALLCIAWEPAAATLTYVRDIEASRDLQLVPGLVVLATAFSIHQAHKHRLARSESRENATLAAGAEAMAAQAESLVGFGHALAAALGKNSRESVYDVIVRSAPGLIPGRDVWVLTRDVDQTWTSIVAVGDSSPAERERAARFAIGETEPSPTAEPRYVCFPLVAGESALGALGVAATPPLTDHQHRVLGATAALMAAALKNADLVRQTGEAGMRDHLTGFFNRAHTMDQLEAEMRRARRSGLPLSIVMLDLDGLKAFNDSRGHLCGDALITAASAAIRSALRGSDVKCRYGGDEFVVLLPETPLKGAEQVAECLRRTIEAQHIWWNGERISATASLGVTAWSALDQSPQAIVARADAALFRAKNLGRNVVSSAPAPAGPPPPPVESPAGSTLAT